MGQAKQRGTKEERIASATAKMFNSLTAGAMLKRAPQDKAIFLQQGHQQLVEANALRERDASREIFFDILLPFSRELDSDLGPYAKVIDNVKRLGVKFWWFEDASDLHGVTLFAKGTPHVFVNVDQDDFQTADTLLHEAVHATGPSLGRWTWEDQPQRLGGSSDLDYEKEELIAVTTAAFLLGVANKLPSDLIDASVIASVEEYWKLADLDRFEGGISLEEVAEARKAAAQFLLRP